MLITISVPDNTSGIFYAESEDGYEREPKRITMDMFVKVEQE